MSEITEGFEVFVRVVEAGSVSAASRAMGVPRETVSRQLSRLEERLGLRLLHRSTRRLVPTPAGDTLYARARPLIAAARDAAEEVRQLDDVPRGLVRISVPPGGGAARMGEVISGFLLRWPEVQVELVASARHVDLAAEGYDLALRAGTIRDPSLVARKLWRSETLALASPGYLRARGTPQAVEDLAAHSCVLGMAGGTQPARRWPLRAGGEIPVQGRFVSDDLSAQLAACRAGIGIALLPQMPMVQAELEAGGLVEVLPGVLGTETSISLVMVERVLLPARVRALFDHVVATFSQDVPKAWLVMTPP